MTTTNFLPVAVMPELALLPINIAAEINEQHTLAMLHANTAIQHAAHAGNLLLQVKESLPHGKFLSWVAENLTVSARQAQRYIGAALGKPTPVRCLAEKANATPVSYLDDQHTPDWLPEGPTLAEIIFSEGVKESAEDITWIHVQEASYAKGFYFVFFLDGLRADFLINPVIGRYVEETIFDLLPGKYLKNTSVGNLPWTFRNDVADDFVASMREPFLPDGYAHLKAKKGAV